jgi:hypothetical protein
MKLLLFALLTFSAMAHATKIVCTSADGSSTLVYDADTMTMEFNKAIEAAPGKVRISGKTISRTAPGHSEFYLLFDYPLADGRNVQMLWMSQETDVLRGLRPVPVHAELKRVDRTLASFPICKRAN